LSSEDGQYARVRFGPADEVPLPAASDDGD
jgi:hypothetical protein